MVKTRTEALHDTDRVREVVTVAFGSAEDADPVDAPRADACGRPDRPLVAEDGTGSVLAHTLLARAGPGGAPALRPACLFPRPPLSDRGLRRKRMG
ncbi:hypothetical protein [Streptomyces hydrogenans]|uniref:hypothetical protein n=1 Tax=Streptomyces hydrogenans TaxID=1873719 RepID=UPI00381007B9